MLKNIRKEFKCIKFPSKGETLKNTASIIGISIIASSILALLNAGVTEWFILFYNAKRQLHDGCLFF